MNQVIFKSVQYQILRKVHVILNFSNDVALRVLSDLKFFKLQKSFNLDKTIRSYFNIKMSNN